MMVISSAHCAMVCAATCKCAQLLLAPSRKRDGACAAAAGVAARRGGDDDGARWHTQAPNYLKGELTSTEDDGGKGLSAQFPSE